MAEQIKPWGIPTLSLNIRLKLILDKILYYSFVVLKGLMFQENLVISYFAKRQFKLLLLFFYLRIHWGLSTILKKSNKSVWSNVFLYEKVCIFWKCIQYNIYWGKTNTKKNSFEHNNSTKSALFFLSQALTHLSFTFKLQFYISWSTETVCGIFQFRFRVTFYYSSKFCWTKCMDSLTFKRHNFFQN